jgi:hypothetical protein
LDPSSMAACLTGPITGIFSAVHLQEKNHGSR